MAGPLSVRDIDDIGFQRKEWAVQRVGWVLVALLVVAALAGVFGAGPLSETTNAAEDGTVEVEYERFIRHVGTTTMTVSLGAASVEDGKAQLYISRDLATGWRLEDVSPAPSTESSTEEWLIYEFDVLGDTPPEVKFLYRGDGFGRHAGVLRAGGGTPVPMWQWIYP